MWDSTKHVFTYYPYVSTLGQSSELTQGIFLVFQPRSNKKREERGKGEKKKKEEKRRKKKEEKRETEKQFHFTNSISLSHNISIIMYLMDQLSHPKIRTNSQDGREQDCIMSYVDWADIDEDIKAQSQPQRYAKV